MKKFSEFVVSRLMAGLLLIVPIYLATLLVLKVMRSLAPLVTPLASLFPERLPAAHLLSLLLVLTICFLIGLAVRTPAGYALWERIENSLFHRIPGYQLFRSLTRRMAGQAGDTAWKPALAEIEEALVPAFIIEQLEDGRVTVFVPSAPTPLAGSIYVLTPDRVHPLNIPFTQALKTVSEWGSGSKDMVAAMEGRAKLTP